MPVRSAKRPKSQPPATTVLDLIGIYLLVRDGYEECPNPSPLLEDWRLSHTPEDWHRSTTQLVEFPPNNTFTRLAVRVMLDLRHTSPDKLWNSDELSLIRTQLTRAYQAAVVIHGQPTGPNPYAYDHDFRRMVERVQRQRRRAI